MSDAAREHLLSGKAWEDFCDNLKRTGQMIDQLGDEVDELDRAEWYRFLTRFLRGGLERYLEAGEPYRPQLREMAWRHSINFTSPMQDHLYAEFDDGSLDYRITGNIGTVPYFVISTWRSDQPADFGARAWAPLGQEGLKQFDPAMLNTTHMLESRNIRFDADGNFSVIVSQKKPAGGEDWMEMTDDCVGLIVRLVYETRDNIRPATMRIERLDGAPPRPIHAADVSRGLAKAVQATLGYAELSRSWWQNNLGKRPNTLLFSKAVYLSNGGVDDNRQHGFGSWKRGPGEALVVRFAAPACEFWTFQLCNIWQENFDSYQDGQGFLYKNGVKLEDDGSILITLSDEDPGIGGNWLDPCGHHHGGWSFRLIKTFGDPPEIVVHRIKLEDLRARGLDGLKDADAIRSGQLTD